MVKRATFLQMFLVAALFVIICAYGLAVAKDKLVLKYLPVDHDIETVVQNNTSNPLSVFQTDNIWTNEIVKNHIGCLMCRDYDSSQCPDCCLYNNKTSIRCDENDPECQNPGPVPFDTYECATNCANTFKRDCGNCTGECARSPQAITHCLRGLCPGITMPVDSRCKEYPVKSDIWYCRYDNLPPGDPCPSMNERVKTRKFDHTSAYGVATVVPFSNCTAANVTFSSSFPCYKYSATADFRTYVANCTAAADKWEDDYYNYTNATLGPKICPAGNCTSGFNQNCDVGACQKKIGLCGNYTIASCIDYENRYQDMLMGTFPNTYSEIDPGFNYKFVARRGERYMISWQILCDVREADPRYNLYTMVKVWDQTRQDVNKGDVPVYNSIVHQKALGSTFYINAQTGMDDKKAPGLIPGHAYVVKLYYFLPNDGETPLRVDISLMQMILYRTKN